MRVVVLVPRRDDGGRRDQLWAWVKARWARAHPEWPVFEGHHDDGPFNRSAAINRAAREAGRWNVAVVADSDSFADATNVEAAVNRAAESGQMVLAYDRWCALSDAMTDAVLEDYNGNWWPGVEAAVYGTCSSLLAVPRRLWTTVGGFDEGFDGWGGEDVAFWRACEALGGGFSRIDGECWHLHHPSAERPNVDANIARCERYGRAANNPAAMRALLRELGVGKARSGDSTPDFSHSS